jgi:hypothetical protein
MNTGRYLWIVHILTLAPLPFKTTAYLPSAERVERYGNIVLKKHMQPLPTHHAPLTVGMQRKMFVVVRAAVKTTASDMIQRYLTHIVLEASVQRTETASSVRCAIEPKHRRSA